MSVNTLMETNSVNLTLTPMQKRIVEEALELYMRTLIGQTDHTLEVLERKHHHVIGTTGYARAKLKEVSRFISDRIWGSTPGISNPNVSADAKEAHDLLDAMRGTLKIRFGMEVLPEIKPVGNPDDQL